ncbi:MAG: hypothetical protein LH616_11375, partial [Ilumatobacteraceae bacterium]|nr:hypothetical protein [Ilumatobacteraceae bacterium]
MRKRSTTSRRLVCAAMAGALVLAACGDDKTTDSTDAPAAETTVAAGTDTTMAAGTDTTMAAGTDTTMAGGDDPLAALFQECLDNGAKVNLIALPDEWANYKGILQSFR